MCPFDIHIHIQYIAIHVIYCNTLSQCFISDCFLESAWFTHMILSQV